MSARNTWVMNKGKQEILSDYSHFSIFLLPKPSKAGPRDFQKLPTDIP